MIDSTNYLGKDESGWSKLPWTGASQNYLAWIYEWEASIKEINGDRGVPLVPDAKRIAAYCDRLKAAINGNSPTYAVIDIESFEDKLHFGTVMRYLALSKHYLDTKWIWYNTHVPPWSYWRVGETPPRSTIRKWHREVHERAGLYAALDVRMISYYPRTLPEVQTYLWPMLSVVRMLHGTAEVIWNMGLQTFTSPAATSAWKPAEVIRAELGMLREAKRLGWIDQISVWAFFNEAQPRKNLTPDIVRALA